MHESTQNIVLIEITNSSYVNLPRTQHQSSSHNPQLVERGGGQRKKAEREVSQRNMTQGEGDGGQCLCCKKCKIDLFGSLYILWVFYMPSNLLNLISTEKTTYRPSTWMPIWTNPSVSNDRPYPRAKLDCWPTNSARLLLR